MIVIKHVFEYNHMWVLASDCVCVWVCKFDIFSTVFIVRRLSAVPEWAENNLQFALYGFNQIYHHYYSF